MNECKTSVLFTMWCWNLEGNNNEEKERAGVNCQPSIEKCLLSEQKGALQFQELKHPFRCLSVQQVQPAHQRDAPALTCCYLEVSPA